MAVRVSVKHIRKGDTILDPTDNREVTVQEVSNTFIRKGSEERVGRLIKGAQNLHGRTMDYRRVFSEGDLIVRTN